MDPYENPSPFTPAQLAACCHREVGKRRGFYPKLVTMNKMSQAEADQEIAKMAAAAAHFEALAAPVRYATATQKEEMTRLLNHPLITRPEKIKMLVNLERLTEAYAERAITNLVQTIELREGMGAAA